MRNRNHQKRLERVNGRGRLARQFRRWKAERKAQRVELRRYRNTGTDINNNREGRS
jgi:hypothetical protein